MQMKLDLLFLIFFPVFSRSLSEDTEVSCVLLESCVLPCSFDPGPDPVIHWAKDPDDKDTPVHIYYRGQTQHQHQHQIFKGRTSLFEEELSTGNASLLLSGVKVQDEGRYKCFTNTVTTDNKEIYVTLRVEAPVLQVSLQQQGQQLVCRSEGVYPKPSVSWSPPSSAAVTTVTSSESGVWSVHSSVSLPHCPPHQYSCNVSNSRSSWRSATYRRNINISVSGVIMVPCTKPTAPVKSLIWRFNHRIILSRSGPEPVYTESWTQFVDEITESNSLVLKGLTKDQLGLFSCELSTEQEQFIIHTEVTETDEHSGLLIVAAAVIGVLLVLTFTFVVLYCGFFQGEPASIRRIRNEQQHHQDVPQEEMKMMEEPPS
ncbi:V-set domain-containing T-cell activation inhibitor 1-like [Periophthalmus magnuspinnatus]|uniref:V-set domain-containing T-cell activation inhibitor 1-like n=1 Tax=Periophthalmus magnuspinnatus TaxID=409849 RepID=UPI00145BD2F7|nr:V-set domain-containing T-cell activation inhibitor 1-like [Periophthalmus magnuspinnatus]